MIEVPEFFQSAIHDYDPCLRVRWSTHLERFVLERRILNPDKFKIDKMRGLYYRRANRNIRNGLSGKDLKEALSKRYVAAAWLEALNDNHRLVELIPGVSSSDLELVMRWLKSNDMWTKANYDGRLDHWESATDRLVKNQTYDEEWAEEAKRRKNALDNRDRNKEIYNRLSWRDGRTISMARLGAR